MVALNAAQRLAIRADIGSRVSERRELFNLTKVQLAAVVAAIDDWQEANAASFNSAIPLPQRTILTAAQKAELFHLVALKRYGG